MRSSPAGAPATGPLGSLTPRSGHGACQGLALDETSNDAELRRSGREQAWAPSYVARMSSLHPMYSVRVAATADPSRHSAGVVRALLAAGADVHVRDFAGETPILLAA